jgi:hypothetical protein
MYLCMGVGPIACTTVPAFLLLGAVLSDCFQTPPNYLRPPPPQLHCSSISLALLTLLPVHDRTLPPKPEIPIDETLS